MSSDSYPRYGNINRKKRIEDEINDGEIDEIVVIISQGYNPDHSFQGCFCCYEPDDLTRCYHQAKLEIFKLLIAHTSVSLLDKVKIYNSPRSIPYLEIMRQYINIPPERFCCYIETNSDFNVPDLNAMLGVIGKNANSIDYSTLNHLVLTSYNKEYYKELLKDGKLDVNKTLLYVINKCDLLYDATREEFAEIGKLCIRLGADTSVNIQFCSNYYYLMKYLLNAGLTINPSNLSTVMSLDELHDKMSRFEIKDQTLHALNKKDFDFICEIYKESSIFQNVLTIQCCVRRYISRKRTNMIRLNPDNLFNVDYTIHRKNILNIDDSNFQNQKQISPSSK